MPKNVRKTDICKNCGTPLSGEYCHQCGQRGDEPRRAVIGLVQDFFVDTLAIDSKLFRSIGLLVWRPGLLARRYLDGRRVYYTPPFRFYLFASVFFFLALFASVGNLATLNGDAARPGSLEISDALIDEVAKEDPDTAAKLRARQAELAAQARAAKEATGEATGEAAEAPAQEPLIVLGEGTDKIRWDEEKYSGPEWAKPHVRRIVEAAARVTEDPRLFFAQTKENLPRTMLLAPVFYALILLLLYFYRRRFYVYDHFVVSLYMHAALYAYLLLALLVSNIPVAGGWLALVPLVWGWWQPFAVLKQAYGSGNISAFVKWLISITVYLIGLSMIITAGFTVSLYQS